MRKFASWAKRGLLVVTPLSLAVATAALAVTPSPADRLNPVMRAAMQRDLGLTTAQLNQYLRTESLAQQQGARLAAAQGRHFAGSWIERTPQGFQLVVATTKIGPQAAPAGVVYRPARNSLADLKASKGQLDTMVERGTKVPKGVYSWYVDLASNTVVIGHAKGAQKAAIDFVAASGADARLVRFVVEQEQARKLATLMGGHGYLRNPGDGYLYACSIGFTVSTGYVTAGHCGNAGETVYLEGSAGTGPQWSLGPTIGSFSGSSFPAPGQSGPDYAYVATNGSQTLSPTVYGWGKGNVTVKGSLEGGLGTAICRSGRTSGWRCGTIDAVDVSVNYTTGETITHVNRTTACSEGGDSGGAFITGPGQGQGVLSGGSGSCKGKLPNNRTRSYYQPLNPILTKYKVTLRTG